MDESGRFHEYAAADAVNFQFILDSYNKFFNKSYDFTILINKPLTLFQTYVLPQAVFVDMSSWLEVLCAEIYPWANQPPYQTHWGHLAGWMERAEALFVAAALHQEIIDLQVLPLMHDRSIAKQLNVARDHYGQKISHHAKSVLYLGDYFSPHFQADGWSEQRIERSESGDVNLSHMADASLGAVVSYHDLPRLRSSKVAGVLAEMRRILNPDGFVILACSDLEFAAEKIVAGMLDAEGEGGRTPLDLIYGTDPSGPSRTGFTLASLTHQLMAAGFMTVGGVRQGTDLWVVAAVGRIESDRLNQLAASYFSVQPMASID